MLGDPRLTPARLGRELEHLLARLRSRLSRADRHVATLEPPGPTRGNVLLSYILEPLLERTAPAHSHTHFFESLCIAETFVQRGYRVDGISWQNDSFVPSDDYRVIIDVRLNLERWSQLPPSTIKVAHLDTCHWRVNNSAQEQRLERLRDRRGVALAPRRLIPPNRLIESADRATYLGNDFTCDSYRFAGKPLDRIPVSVPFTYDWLQQRDFERSHNRFVWFGSGGLVHKGLDLVLEVFAKRPDLELVVCGPIERERDFERHYLKELYLTPNISTLGWVDVSSKRFLDIAAGCSALIYPSCAEGGGASALTCMHAGLVPILTREASVDVTQETGVLLKDTELETIEAALDEHAQKRPSDVEATARAAWEWVQAHHSREHFVRDYADYVDRLLQEVEEGSR